VTYTSSIFDTDDSLGLGYVEVEYEMEYTVDPGDPGCWRTPNGDGWPSSPASIEMVNLEITGVYPPKGSALPLPLTPAWLETVKQWADRRLELEWPKIEQRIFKFLEQGADA
jgi:hypothetical protein